MSMKALTRLRNSLRNVRTSSDLADWVEQASVVFRNREPRDFDFFWKLNEQLAGSTGYSVDDKVKRFTSHIQGLIDVQPDEASSSVPITAIQHLQQIRESISDASPYPWDDIGNLVQQALPLVRTSFNEHLEEFRQAAERPTYSWLPAMTDPDEEDGYDAKREEECERDFRKNCDKAKARVLSQLDGMIVASSCVTQDVIAQGGQPMSPIERLTRLRSDLEGLEPFPWQNLEQWIQRATPTLRTTYKDHLEDFQKASKRPPYPVPMKVMALRHKQPNAPEVLEHNRKQAEWEVVEFRQTRERILAFLDGLIALGDAPPSLNEDDANMPDPRNVFVVHGRNLKAKDAMFAFLRSLDLNPLEWNYMVSLTGETSPYVGDVLDAGFKNAKAIVVVLTPDEEARLTPSLTPAGANDEQGLQPRQNVIFEAGMAMGICKKRTILVEFGKLRPISDVHGRHTIRMDGSADMRKHLVGRLETAGCKMNTHGDWLNAGDFTNCLKVKKPAAPRKTAKK